MQRLVVAIDPALSVGKDSDETGLIVAGRGTDGEGYVLEDASGKYQPVEWARRAVAAYRKWSGDRVIGEANNGGLLVAQTIRTVDPNVSFKSVHASRGKIARAEPISALFEQKRAHLVGSFPELEDQLCTFTPGSSGSPDRLDALVWALSELMVRPGNSAEAWIGHYRSLAEAGPAPLFDVEGDPLPWRSGFPFSSPGKELTKLYRETYADLTQRIVDASPNNCSRCRKEIVKGATVVSDGVEAWHPECRRH
jgi:hypothetical protein